MEDRARIVVWAQEPGWSKALCWILTEAGFEVAHSTDEMHAVALVKDPEFDAAVVDFGERTPSGSQVVQQMHRVRPELPIVLTSAQLEPTLGLSQHPNGVWRRIRRPDELDHLAPAVREAIAHSRTALPRNGSGVDGHPGVERLGTFPDTADVFGGVLVGETLGIRNARRLVAQVAPSEMTVLVRGESGTGKDVLARVIHQLSKRARSGDFVKINCPAIPESLLESELFGYEKGAFTGAVSQKPGRLELAEGGTIFLDEIGLLSLGMQGKLLDVIEHKQFVRVGGKETIRVDARIVAATNAPLEEMIAAGTFRPDLFYRLRQFTITLPPLRERAEDIPLLCEHFLRICAMKEGFKHTRLPAESMARLVRYPWPGNVRELEALMTRYALCGDVETLEQALTSSNVAAPPVDDKLEAAELSTILAALTECRWNRRRAAANLGISYSALRRRMAKHRIDRPRSMSGTQTPGR
jgi:DNA-binding NtrC family response regulator